MTSILDYLVLGVILLDDRGHVSYANRSAAEMLGVCPGSRMPRRRRNRRDKRTEALYRGYGPEGRSRRSTDTRRTGGHSSCSRPSSPGPTTSAWLRGVSGAPSSSETPRNGAAIRPEDGSPLWTTPSETEAGLAARRRLSLTEAAAQLGITQSTARTVLKRALAKTGARRQASLVRLLLSGPGQLRSDSRAAPWAVGRAGGRGRRRR